MTDLNGSLLSDKFNIYYSKAKKEHESGNLILAKRNYLLAAESLMKLAKNSSQKLKEIRVAKAKKLTMIADGLSDSKKVVKKEISPSKDSSQWEALPVENICFDDVIGLEDVKKAILISLINPIKYPDKYILYNKKTGGGLLLFGPPGTGKTMIAKAIANEVNAKFYVIKCSNIISKFVGESERNINALFEKAKKDSLAVIFVDEMDSLFSSRGQDVHNDKRVNEFLQQIDGFASKNSSLLLLGATNRPWDIDVAAMRSGRFSKKIYVTLPDKNERKFLFQKFMKNLPLANDIDIDELVLKTENYSGADIEQICEIAKEEPLLQSIKLDKVVLIDKHDFDRALKEVVASADKAEIEKFEVFAKKIKK